MRRTRRGLALLVLALLGLSGCKSAQEHIKPPKIPEECVAPPDIDKYNKPIEYPKDSLNVDRNVPKDFTPAGGGGSPAGLRGPTSRGGMTPGSY
jgi:hypothetical protein